MFIDILVWGREVSLVSTKLIKLIKCQLLQPLAMSSHSSTTAAKKGISSAGTVLLMINMLLPEHLYPILCFISSSWRQSIEGRC